MFKNFQCAFKFLKSVWLTVAELRCLHITTTSNALITCLWVLKLSRIILFKRFRCTAVGTFFLLTITPNLGRERWFALARTVYWASADLIGCENTLLNSLEDNRRSCFANRFDRVELHKCYGLRRARPRALRARITALPPRVFIRARNPCVLARRKLLGW